MAGTASTGTSVAELKVELAGFENLRAREVNEKHGDDQGVSLGKLRAVAKRLKMQHQLARDLREIGDTAARLLALLVCRWKEFGRGELDTMLRWASTPNVQDSLVNHGVKRTHAQRTCAWPGPPTSIPWRPAPAGTDERTCGEAA